MLTKTTHTKLIILIDPDKFNLDLIKLANTLKIVAYIFVGGSKLKDNNLNKIIRTIKLHTKIPIIIFPGDETQLSKHANGILILSLISGLNPDYLITKHIKAAQKIKSYNLLCIPTGYILIDGGKKSTTQKVTKTTALTSPQQIINTAVAGEQMGKKLIYLEAGSGANKIATPALIKKVKQQITIPLVIGGGINTIEKAKLILSSKPDYLVIGNALEKKPEFLIDLNKLF